MPFFERRYSVPGAAPGLGHDDSEGAKPSSVRVIDYAPEGAVEKELESLEEAFPHLADDTVTWLDIVGLQDVATLRSLGAQLGIHPLVLEDLIHVGQRPKLEEHEGHLFIVLRLIHEGEGGLQAEQISLLVGPNWVVSLQEREGDCFAQVRERIRHGKGRIRRRGSDYLAYALIDALVDHFFPLLERYGERIEALEDEISGTADKGTLSRIHNTKKELLVLRRAAWPQREVIHGLERLESGLVAEETGVFLRDCYDHSIQIMDIVDNYRDLAGDLTDFYLSTVSNRTNEVMRVLTIMASIFIPLTFLAGIYGMNFNPEVSPFNMPELNWAWGYPAALGAMLALGVGMVAFFRRKKWL